MLFPAINFRVRWNLTSNFFSVASPQRAQESYPRGAIPAGGAGQCISVPPAFMHMQFADRTHVAEDQRMNLAAFREFQFAVFFPKTVQPDDDAARPDHRKYDPTVLNPDLVDFVVQVIEEVQRITITPQLDQFPGVGGRPIS